MKIDRTRWAERVLGTAGVLLLAFCGFLYIDGSIQSRIALKEFTAELPHATAADQLNGATSDSRHAAAFAVNTSGSSGIAASIVSSKPAAGAAAAVAELKVPKLGLDLPVFADTSRRSLNRGAGWIAGTAAPSDANGTIGIAGHRDRFFRPLKQIARGDEIVLASPQGVQTFTVDAIAIVTPKNTAMLRSGTQRALALVTCYPFSYIGPAPKRFVVHAYLKQQITTNSRSGAEEQMEQQVAPERRTNRF